MQVQRLPVRPADASQLPDAQLPLAVELKLQIRIPDAVAAPSSDALEGILPPEAAVLLRAMLQIEGNETKSEQETTNEKTISLAVILAYELIFVFLIRFGFMSTYHINGQYVEAFALAPPKVECDRMPLRGRHLSQVRAYGARVGRSLMLQSALL